MSPEPRHFTLPSRARPDEHLAVTRLDAAPASSRALPEVLFCGGFHSSMSGNKARVLAAHCADTGLACTRFDYRGHGASGGEARDLTLRDWLDDTLRIIDEVCGEAPLLIVGSSMGAWIAVHAARLRPGRVGALLLIAAAPDFLQERLPEALGAAGRARLAAGREARLDTPDDPNGWPVTPALIDSGRELALLDGEAASAVRCPVRMLHGEHDDIAPLARALALLARLGSTDATLTVLKGGDHRLSDTAALGRLTRTLDELVSVACA